MIPGDAPKTHAAPKRDPENNRERIYGLIPIPGDENYKAAFKKRMDTARERQRHTTIIENEGERKRDISCVNCALHLADWEGEDEGSAPICVDEAGSFTCIRCLSDGKQCEEPGPASREAVGKLDDVAMECYADWALVSVTLYLPRHGVC